MTHEIAVIGARRSNVPDYWDDSRIAFLTSEEVEKRGLPKNVKTVIFTKFLGHSAFGSALEEARKRGLRVIPGLSGTGQLKSTLSQLLVSTQVNDHEVAHIPPIPEVTMAEPTPPRGRMSGATGWVREYLENRPDVTLSEILVAGQVAGFKRATINSAFYKAKEGVRGKKVKVKSTPKAASRLIGLLDDAIAALQLIREEAVAQDRKFAKFEKVMETMKGLTSS